MRFFCVLLMLLPLCGAATAQEAQSNQPSGAISVEDSASQDAAIAVRIRDILAELEGYGDVTVTVRSGIVTLRGTTLEAADIARLNVIVARVEGVVAIKNEVTESTDVVERLSPAMERFTDRMEQLVAYLPLLIVAIAAFLLVTFAGILLTRLKNPWNRLAPNRFIADIYRSVIRLVFIIGGVVVALDILGATALLSTILGAAGIVGLAIGFAVKDTVENFIASIMLSIRQPFRPNDAIEIGGDQGIVIRLTSRATILLSYDGNHIRIPNSTVFKSRIVNYTTNAERRFTFDLGVAPDTDLTQAMALARDTLSQLPFVLQTPAPNVWIDTVGDSTISLRHAAWIDQRETGLLGARSEAVRQVMSAFTLAGIAMPEPTYRLLTKPIEPPPPISTKPAIAAPADAPLAEIEATMEQDLERFVEEERQDSHSEDLLSEHGPTE
ncbi:MAG: mechanosensitive ion channel protein MscS [Rhodobacteraceae bacterium]|nr:mechanosensitive ion channel protein MscS [Paracoccaceae bacterium]